jgi:hypothetical protein
MTLSAEGWVQARAPQLLGHARLEPLFIAYSEEYCSSVYGSLRNKVIALHAMHVLTLEKVNNGTELDSGASTSIKRHKIGDEEVEYNTEGGDLGRTEYGRELMRLKQSIPTLVIR